MKLFDLINEENKEQSKEKAVPGFTVTLNKVGKRYNYSKSGFIIKGANVFKGETLPLKPHVIKNIKSEDKGELYARR